MAPRTAKDVDKQGLDDPQLVDPIEALVEGQDGTRSLHTVARQTELVHGVDVAHLELDGRARSRRPGLPHPQVGVHPLPTFEEQDRGARAHLGNVVDGLGHAAADVGPGLARIELGLILGVRDQRPEVLQQVPVPGRDAPAAQRQAPLLVVIPAVGLERLDGRGWSRILFAVVSAFFRQHFFFSLSLFLAGAGAGGIIRVVIVAIMHR